MNITHYLAILDCSYACKNKLQKDALQYFEKINRKLVLKSEVEEFKK